MWAKLLAIVPAALQFLNTVFSWFKKTPQGEREKVEKENQKNKDEFSKTGRPV